MLTLLLLSIGMLHAVNPDSLTEARWNENAILQGKFLYSDTDSAFIYARRCLNIAIEMADVKLIGSSHTQMGLLYFLKQNFDSALFSYNKSIRLFKSINDTSNVVRAKANKGNVFMYTGHLDSAVVIYLEVLDYFNKKNDTKNQANINGTLGNLFMQRKEHKEAFYHYKKSKQYFHLINNDHGVAICNQNMGIIFKRQRLADSALFYFSKALEFFDKKNIPHSKAQMLANMAEVYSLQKQFGKAESFYDEAIVIFRQLKTKRDLNLTLIQKSQMLLEGNRYSDVLEILSELKNSYTDLVEVNLQGHFDSISYIAHKKLGNYRNALLHLERHAAYNDSISHIDLRANENRLLAEFNVEKREQEIKLLEAEDVIKAERLRKQSLIMIFGGLLLLLLIAVSFVVYGKYRYKHRMNLILREKNEEIQSQSEEIGTQNEILLQQKEDITSSIAYANLIQRAILHHEPNRFLEVATVSKPKDVVSGDFFWQYQTHNFQFVAVADSTGHGVPGAFMSILGHSLLNYIVERNPDIDPAEILNALRLKIKETLHQQQGAYSQNDGMDIALCKIDTDHQNLLFAGAYRPCWIVNQEGFTELKPDRQPIGIHPMEKPFTQQSYTLREDDVIYMFTDGITDQYGGNKGAKLKMSGFKALVSSISNLSPTEQASRLEVFIDDFIGYNDQIDDILISVIRLKNSD